MSKALFYIGQPSDSATALVTASQSTRTIDAATVCNTTAGAVTLTLYVVPADDSAADDVTLYKAFSIDAGASVVLSGLINQCIPSGATLNGLASAATSLTLTISGRSA